jgi:hypothetical protein
MSLAPDFSIDGSLTYPCRKNCQTCKALRGAGIVPLPCTHGANAENCYVCYLRRQHPRTLKEQELDAADRISTIRKELDDAILNAPMPYVFRTYKGHNGTDRIPPPVICDSTRGHYYVAANVEVKCGDVVFTHDDVSFTTKPEAPKDPMKSFFVLWNPLSSLPPQVKFATEKEARDVAEGMARKHSAPFYIMKAVGVAELQPTPVKVTKLK